MLDLGAPQKILLATQGLTFAIKCHNSGNVYVCEPPQALSSRGMTFSRAFPRSHISKELGEEGGRQEPSQLPGKDVLCNSFLDNVSCPCAAPRVAEKTFSVSEMGLSLPSKKCSWCDPKINQKILLLFSSLDVLRKGLQSGILFMKFYNFIQLG